MDLEKGKKTYGIGVGNHKAWIDDESVKGIPYKNTERGLGLEDSMKKMLMVFLIFIFCPLTYAQEIVQEDLKIPIRIKRFWGIQELNLAAKMRTFTKCYLPSFLFGKSLTRMIYS